MFIDFEYDGQYLSDFGFMPCVFDNDYSTGLVHQVSKLTYNTVPRSYGKEYSLSNTQYDECVEATFDICKIDCGSISELEITSDEYRDLMRWLNRREFLLFRAIDDFDDNRDMCYYYASFNIEKIRQSDQVYGLTLQMTTNRPWGVGEEKTFSWTTTASNKVYKFADTSDEIGYTYPDVTITLLESGNLILDNSLDSYALKINNCTKGEVITIQGATQIISSNLSSHAICDDFNFEFPRIVNTIDDVWNEITCSLQCDIQYTYRPIIKELI